MVKLDLTIEAQDLVDLIQIREVGVVEITSQKLVEVQVEDIREIVLHKNQVSLLLPYLRLRNLNKSIHRCQIKTGNEKEKGSKGIKLKGLKKKN